MKVRNLCAHRARLSYEKPCGWMRKDGALVMWNTRGWYR